MNELTFNDKNLSEFSAYVATSNFLSGAQKDVESIVVPGRSGELQVDNHRFQNQILRTTVYITKNLKENTAALRSYLNSCSGYCRYEESLDSTHYRMASFHSAFEPHAYDRLAGAVILEFDAMPQRWLKSGESFVNFTANGSITNPTLFDAYPIVRIKGAGTVQIGSATITVSKAGTSYIDVDTDLFIAYEGSADRGSQVSISGQPVLKANASTGITLNKVTSVSLMPRWYEI